MLRLWQHMLEVLFSSAIIVTVICGYVVLIFPYKTGDRR